MLVSAAISLLYITVASAQFHPRFRYYSPQEFLDMVDPPPVMPSFPSFLAISHSQQTVDKPKTIDSEFSDVFNIDEKPPGVVPKFTGGFTKDSSVESREQFVQAFQGPVTNPAATFLANTNFDKITPPRCRLLSCTGPIPNDGSANLGTPPKSARSSCDQVIVPINGCIGGSGYPMGMLCSICCDCTRPVIQELLKIKNF